MRINWTILKDYIIACKLLGETPTQYTDIIAGLEEGFKDFDISQKFKANIFDIHVRYKPTNPSVMLVDEDIPDKILDYDIGGYEDAIEILQGYFGYKYDLEFEFETTYFNNIEYYETSTVKKGRTDKICAECGGAIPIGMQHKVVKNMESYSNYPVHEDCLSDFVNE